MYFKFNMLGVVILIQVKNLTKKYGNNTAIQDLSFTVEKGGVYGFLGPNGAGKSTTMNIITGCLAQTSGEVTINGHDIFEEPMLAKKMIGYLPEIPPLYTDMTPFEYLNFVANAKGIRKNEIPDSVQKVMDETGLNNVKDRLIRNLSKGYRQRVGIAQAMLGDPEIIILDEPTVGLDPRQIIEIRDLIKNLGEEHTVILSSHILSEIQAVCDHVIIIARGRVVADDTIENISKTGEEIPVLHVIAKTDPDTAVSIADSFEEITHYAITECEDGTDLMLTLSPDSDVREKIFFAFSGAGIALLEFSTVKHSLEEIYLNLTESVSEEVEEIITEESNATEESSTEEYESVFSEGAEEEFESVLSEETEENEEAEVSENDSDL